MLSNKRNGAFTGSTGYNLFIGGKGVTRDNYIFDKADEIFRGHPKRTKTYKAMEHGLMNEYEGIEAFKEVTGFNAVYLDQEYFEINDNCGATPDFKVIDFNDIIIASGDIKCPTETYSKQKYIVVKDSLPKFQNTPKQMYYQAQWQMMALTAHNKKLGHPPVTKHYLARYLTKMDIDDLGNKIEYDLPLNLRLFYKVIEADELVQEEILKLVEQAAAERDVIVNILRTPIL